MRCRVKSQRNSPESFFFLGGFGSCLGGPRRVPLLLCAVALLVPQEEQSSGQPLQHPRWFGRAALSPGSRLESWLSWHSLRAHTRVPRLPIPPCCLAGVWDAALRCCSLHLYHLTTNHPPVHANPPVSAALAGDTNTPLNTQAGSLSRAGQVPRAQHGSQSNLLGCSGFCSTPPKPQRQQMAPGDAPLQDLVCSTGVVPGTGSRAALPTLFQSGLG